MLSVNDLHKAYGDGRDRFVAIDGLTFDVQEGEFVCIVGPSGCGKTTMLKVLSGLIGWTGGSVELRGREIDGTPDELAMVFQEYGRSLLPWLSVIDNVMMPLKYRGIGRAARRDIAMDALGAVGLADHLDKHPWQLSGGMQQRVAIARALAYRPQLLLMDEPFASVDAQTRSDLEDLTLQVWEQYGITILFVTHDIDESIYLADRVIVLSKSPCSVHEQFTVDLPRPRDQIETKSLQRFVDLRAHVVEAIRGPRAETHA